MVIMSKTFPVFGQRAIFGGHISGRRLRGVKINPIFHDPEHYYSAVSNSTADDRADDQCPQDSQIHIDVYESLPRPARLAQLKGQTQSEPDLLELDSSSPELSPHWTNSLSRNLFALNCGTDAMRDEHQETEMEKSDSSSSLGKDESVKEGAVESVGDREGAVSSECVPKISSDDSDDKPQSSNQHKDLTEVDTSGTGSPSRRLSDSSMIVYEDVDQASFPMLSSVLSHMNSYTEDASGSDVQENILLYTSDGESPTNDLTSGVPCERSRADWPNMADITLPSDSEEGSMCNDVDVPEVACSTASSKPLRPILLTTSSNDDSNAFPKSPNLSPSEHKTVTFAKDTVFNEDKPKRYQKEKINLKELYHERVCGRSGMGMVNPVFVISDEKLTLAENAGDCLTDDEKAKRHSFKINLVSARPSGMDTPSVSSDNSSPSPRMPDLNTPAYLQKYLEKSMETSLDRSRETTLSGSSTPMPSTSSATTAELNEMNDINAANDIILELPEDIYGRRERKKYHRRKVMKWTAFILTGVIIVIVAMAVGIYFANKSSDDSVETTTLGV